jgi:ribokinase
MTDRPRLVVVGDLVTDVVARPERRPAPDTDTPARIVVVGGGSAANTAAWAATAGTDVLLVARVGDDEAGRDRAAELERAGVGVALATDPLLPTGSIVVLVGPDGRRTMLTDRGASAALAPDDLPHAAFSPRAHLHLSGYTLLGEDSRECGLAALRLAARCGMSASVTPASAAPLADVGPARFLEWTAHAGLCIANREEAAVLLGEDASPAELAEGLAAHYGEAVVTAGESGAAWAARGERALHAPAHELPGPVLDTTGAGDAFAAGFLAARISAQPPAAALDAGLALAATAVRRQGARPHGASLERGGGAGA